MVFTEKTFNKCVDSISKGDIYAILFIGPNFGLATLLADKAAKIISPEETEIIDNQDVDKDFGIILHTAIEDGFFSSKKVVKVYNVKSKISKEIQFLTE